MVDTPPAAVILVEGASDRVALETLAARAGRDLETEGVEIVPAGGSKGIAELVGRFGPGGLGVRLAGLCDAGEEPDLRRALERAGLGAGLDRAAMEALGFYLCDADLEDELIRALGTDAVESVIEAAGERGRWRTFQKQPGKAGQPRGRQLRRFVGARSGAKAVYARLFVEALDLDRIPRPLERVLRHVP